MVPYIHNTIVVFLYIWITFEDLCRPNVFLTLTSRGPSVTLTQTVLI